MTSLRLTTSLLLVALLTLVLPVAGSGPTVDAATYKCPVENRTTRPNNGGAPVASFAVTGLDLSHWNGGYKMSDAEAAGFTFEWYKATQGTYLVDKTYNAGTKAAIKAGIKAGAYHFFDYRLDGKAQARYFVAAVKARGGFHGHLRPVVDVECLGVLGKPVPSKSVPRLRAFLTEVKRLIGVTPIVYTSIYEWKTVTGGSSKFSDTTLWSAEWGKTAPLKFPPSWTKWTFWQHGSVYVGAAKTRLDANVYVSSATALKKWIVK